MKKSFNRIFILVALAITINMFITPKIALTNDFDFDEAIIYFLLTDRFNNGDTSNDDPNGEMYDKTHFETYHGGDFQGLIDKLDYLKELGVNTIWISPIVDNINFNMRYGKDAQYGYHGYWAKDFTQIDEHLGDLELFKKLIDEIHDRGMKLMVDVVINHTGYGMKQTDDENGIPNYPTSEDKEVFKDMLRLEPVNSHPTLGELSGLPDFITEEENVRNQVIAWHKDWIEKARTDKGNTIDYFRVDTVKHVDLETLKEFKDQVIEIKEDFKMIGEYFDGSVNFNGEVLNQGGMDSILDFDFKNIVRDYLRGKFEENERKLIARNEKLTPDKTTGAFLSSHDEHGFLAMKLNNDQGLFKVASTLQMTAKGQPVIYYGEEIGISGKNAGNMDNGEFSENRYDFDWTKTENNDMLDHYKKLLKIRNDNTEIFTKGDRKFIYGDKESGVSIFERTLNGEAILVFLNIGEDDKKVRFNVNTEDSLFDIYGGNKLVKKEDSLVEILLPSKNLGGTAMVELHSETANIEVRIEGVESNKDDIHVEVPVTDEDTDNIEVDDLGEKVSKESKKNKIPLIGGGALVILLVILVYIGQTNENKK